MTYGCLQPSYWTGEFAAVSHLAELVRGDFSSQPVKAPSSALRAPSPQGEKVCMTRR